MQLSRITLINFKNYTEVSLDDFRAINVLLGKNGSGKTNFLDAIHYLSLTKSAFASPDTNSIRKGEKFFTIKGEFDKEGSKTEVLCSVQSGSKKIIREGLNEYAKVSDHIGKFPVVLIAPDDTEMIKEGSEERRKFFDSLISQLDKAYLEALIRYTHVLKQRNSLLKMFAETNRVDNVAIESYDHVLIETGSMIHAKRKSFLDRYVPVFEKYYKWIVDDEPAHIVYSSELNSESFENGLQKNRQRDILLQRTNFGIHRDDFLFTLTGSELKRFGSQGQKKSFVIALKLAQFEITKTSKKTKPILLLDDIFDKLDDDRISRLLELIRKNELGQLFITDARPDRTSELLRHINVPAKVFNVNNGVILPDKNG